MDRTYDARNRLKTLSFPVDQNGNGNGDQAWSYYPDGKPQQISTWNIGVENGDPKETRNIYTYFNRGFVRTELIAVPAWYTFSVTHDYNANGHPTKLWYPSGHAVTTSVNALGQPTAISGSGGAYASGITHHPNGAVAGFTYGNGIVHAMVQNARQLPDTVSSVYAGEEFLHDGYAYDEHANVLAIADLRLGEGGARSRAMTYDGMDRLTTVASPMYGTTGANYAYNVLDDLVHVNIGGKPEHTRNHHYCYNAEHQLAEIRTGGCGGMRQFELKFDDQGNLKSRKPEGGTAQGYRFDFGNRLREVDGVERYRYDGHGRRVLAMQFVQGTVLSQYGLDGKLLYQKSDRTGLQSDHVYLGNSLVAIHERPASGTGPEPVKYQHTDGLGSPAVVTRQDRSRAEESEYEPYGLVINRPPRDGPGYTGHVEDAATGLVYMQQRYYDPMIGRFLSVDPVTTHDAKDWRLLNRYGYAFNNPYGFTDPDGRRATGKDEPPPPPEPTTIETITVRGDPGSSLPQPRIPSFFRLTTTETLRRDRSAEQAIEDGVLTRTVTLPGLIVAASPGAVSLGSTAAPSVGSGIIVVGRTAADPRSVRTVCLAAGIGASFCSGRGFEVLDDLLQKGHQRRETREAVVRETRDRADKREVSP